MTPHPSFSKTLLSWFDDNGRKDLPWQKNKTAYRVWVSEIMLQQTQVSAVIDYYQRFMSRFPTIQDLANASIDDVLSHWAGLGYYARARNLHKSAITVCEEYSGVFPETLTGITALPGIGRSTAGAILSIVFKAPHPILDGNVKRVLARLHNIDGWPGAPAIEKQLWALADAYTPDKRCAEYTQAIMDFGATLCTRSKPKCTACPFNKQCESLNAGTVARRPNPKPKTAKPTKELWLLDVRNSNDILLEKRPPSGIWGGLYSLLELDRAYGFEELEEALLSEYKIKAQRLEQQKSFEHVFSHYKLVAHVVRVDGAIQQGADNQVHENGQILWQNSEELDQLGMPAPIKKYFARVRELP